MTMDQIIGQNGNREFTNLVTVMGCNVGQKFDINKLNYSKIVIASDGDIDGYFIRSLLLAFYFKLFPDIIKDGRLYIAEPPLYRVDDKKDPFVVNKADYINRYVSSASKHYKLGYQHGDDDLNIEYLKKDDWTRFLDQTSNYVDDMNLLVEHYKTNDRLLEIILEEFVIAGCNINGSIKDEISHINIQHLLNRIGEEFPEIYYDEEDSLFKGVIDAKYQIIEITEQLVRKAKDIIEIMQEWMSGEDGKLVLKDLKSGTEYRLSLLGVLKVLKRYQPQIQHRYKGLGENDYSDLKTTIMDPNTRTLLKVYISDIENDMQIMQILRGSNQSDVDARRQMIREFQVDRDMIDT